MIGLVIDKQITGTYNLGSRQGLSKADFAFEFAKALGLDTKSMTRAKVSEVEFVKTYRPKDMRLDVNKFEQTLDVILPTLQQEVLKVSKEYTR
jgi:dTDP-4-dehydrorhamnose reductase